MDVGQATGLEASRSVSVHEAVSAAASCAPTLAASTPVRRAGYLEAIAAALDEHADELVAIADEETALGEARLRGEVARTTGQARLFADVLREGSHLEVTIDHAVPDATPPRPDLRRYLIPLGPVAVFTASNFPFAFSVAGGDTVSALAGGCPVVVKGHSGHPRLSRRTAGVVRGALHDAGAPAGTLTHVEGREAGRELVVSPPIRAVGFTGSLAGGRALFDLAVSRADPIPFYGELGSINPVVVAPLAARRRAHEIADGLAASFTLGAGQFCTKPGVVFVPERDDLTEALRQAASGIAPATMLTPRIREAFGEGVQTLLTADRVEPVLGATAPTSDGQVGPFAFVTSAEALRAAPETLLEERFGPAVLLVRYRDLEDLVETLGVLPGSLTASVHADPDDLPSVEPVVARLRDLAGRLVFDQWPTGVAVTWSMQHGGPWPATTDPLHTSVGATAIRRFLRPVTYQNAAPGLLPEALREDNPWRVPRRVDGRLELLHA